MADNTDNNKTASEEKDEFENWLDRNFESPFFALRYITLVPVLLSFVGVIVMFFIGAVETWEAVEALLTFFTGNAAEHDAALKTSALMLIRSVDAFLLGLVLLIFSYGIYDLFVSRLEPAHKQFTRPH